ncbi:hypothetical protein Smp_153070 [Schistosoma mansoni]|uniref:hypothetical protein n=1 Tax=Schistosoma mansoni TaxID=6183 RepID=UPI0001A63676|nr:hypothetical protein Smp_153070 [Schistosoma mansoni]|eukprot:XP_018653585.1 hypothetical protein Smp_153070 [Schistosoma mansoni]
MLGYVLKITIILIAWTSHFSAQFELKNYPNLPAYYGEDPSEELVKSKLKDSELYDRYRIRRHFMPQRFGKRYTSKFPINVLVNVNHAVSVAAKYDDNMYENLLTESNHLGNEIQAIK